MSEKYLGKVSTPLLINQIKENCTQKRSTLPIASVDELGNTYQYMGITSGSLVHGYFYECVSDGQTPATYSWVALIDFGTASIKNSTDRVLPNSTDLVESRAVYSAINTALSSIYTPRGNITCAELTSALLISDNIGSVYETSDSGTTTALFLQGAGHPIAVGSNVGVINAGQDRILFNLMPNAFDLTDYQKKDLTSAVEGQTTVESALGVLSTNKQSKDLATAVESATTVEGALGALSDNKQAKTLTTSVESQTTVEGALGALSTNKATQAEVNDMNNVLGAKNLLPFNISDIIARNIGGTWNGNTYTRKGVTFTVNDGSITCNGTATDIANVEVGSMELLNQLVQSYGKLILSGCPSGGSSTTYQMAIHTTNGYIYDRGDGLELTSDMTFDSGGISIQIRSGYTASDLTFYPMLRLASITDDTYEPYAKTNLQLTQDSVTWDNLSEVGAVNYCDNTGSTQAIDGVSFTVNNDKSVTVEVPNTTRTTTTVFTVNTSSLGMSAIPSGTYKVSGCPSGGNRPQETYWMSAKYDSNVYATDTGTGAIVTVTSFSNVQIAIGKNCPSGTYVFKPMITSPSYNGPYVPYAKTNKELTEINEYEVDTTSISNVVIMKRNNVVTVKVNGSFNIVHNQNYVVGQLPERFRPPLNVASPIVTNEGTPKLTVLAINSTGQIEINGYMIATSGTYPFDGIMTFVTNK